jgi:hypothetical protein
MESTIRLLADPHCRPGAPVRSQRKALGEAAGACSEATAEAAGQRRIPAISEIYREKLCGTWW